VISANSSLYDRIIGGCFGVRDVTVETLNQSTRLRLTLHHKRWVWRSLRERNQSRARRLAREVYTEGNGPGDFFLVEVVLP